MVDSERAMIRDIEPSPSDRNRIERFTSLQPTYEDSVPPEPDDWDEDQ